jgi:hypothetical protein
MFVIKASITAPSTRRPNLSQLPQFSSEDADQATRPNTESRQSVHAESQNRVHDMQVRYFPSYIGILLAHHKSRTRRGKCDEVKPDCQDSPVQVQDVKATLPHNFLRVTHLHLRKNHNSQDLRM